MVIGKAGYRGVLAITLVARLAWANTEPGVSLPVSMVVRRGCRVAG